MSHADQHPITPATRIADAGHIWLTHLEMAGLDTPDLLDEVGPEEFSEAERRDYEAQRHHSQRTIESYRTALRLFLRWLEREQRSTVGSLQLADLLRYVRLLRSRSYDLSKRAERAEQTAPRQPHQRLSPRTIHSYTRPLLGFLTMLESREALGFSVATAQAELSRLLPRVPEPVAPTPPDLRRVVAFYDRPAEQEDRTERLLLIRLRNAALLHILFSTGARISEILALNVGDVCRDRHIQTRVPIYSKGRRQGIIFIRRPAERALQTYLAARQWPPATLPLFESLDRRTAGARLSRTSGWRIVHLAATSVADRITLEGKHDEAALLRTTSPHTFRHFVGYYLLNEGVELAEVSQILRHRSIEVTRSYYASYSDMQLQEVHDQFSADPFSDEALPWGHPPDEHTTGE